MKRKLNIIVLFLIAVFAFGKNANTASAENIIKKVNFKLNGTSMRAGSDFTMMGIASDNHHISLINDYDQFIYTKYMYMEFDKQQAIDINYNNREVDEENKIIKADRDYLVYFNFVPDDGYEFKTPLYKDDLLVNGRRPDSIWIYDYTKDGKTKKAVKIGVKFRLCDRGAYKNRINYGEYMGWQEVTDSEMQTMVQTFQEAAGHGRCFIKGSYEKGFYVDLNKDRLADFYIYRMDMENLNQIIILDTCSVSGWYTFKSGLPHLVDTVSFERYYYSSMELYFGEIKAIQKQKVYPLRNKKKRSIYVSWEEHKAADGYEIWYSTNKKFKKGVKKVKTTKTYKTLKKLKKNKTYYVKVRYYDKTFGKVGYSKWSKTLKCKVKV